MYCRKPELGEYFSNDLVKQGIDRLLLALGIRLDEDYILDATRKSYQV